MITYDGSAEMASRRSARRLAFGLLDVNGDNVLSRRELMLMLRCLQRPREERRGFCEGPGGGARAGVFHVAFGVVVLREL